MTARVTPTDWRQRQAAALNSGDRTFELVDQMGNYAVQPDKGFDYLSQAEDLAFRADQLRKKTLNQIATNSQIKMRNAAIRHGAGNIPIPGSGGLAALLQAIRGQESGGNYQAVNPDSGAAGGYQIMPGNFVGEGGWDKDALGRDISMQFFLNHPHAQNRIARDKLGNYLRNYGPAGAASAWYSGDPHLWNSRDPQGNYPSIHDYVMEVLRRMGR